MKANLAVRTSCLSRAFPALAALTLLGIGLGLPFAARLGRPTEAARAAEPGPEPEPAVLVAVETFKGKLHLRWKPVRPDPTHVSLTKNKGKLTITTQRGTIHADEVARKEPKARNIYLVDNLLPDDADFEVTTIVSGFTPKKAYQQAALILYDDDDNYLKWSYEFSGDRVALALVRETKAKTEHDHVAAPEKAGVKLWLRLTRRKNSYEYASSTDGKKFTAHGERAWGDKAPARVGILAKNGGPVGVPEVDVCFERFELRSPPPPKK
jgi:regulation of enolase protein 1 (concanavalin A-like superfamily)